MAAPKRKPAKAQPRDVGRLDPVLRRVAGHKVMRLLGYWALVQTYGGWQGVAAAGFWPEGSVQRYRLEFREAFGMEAEEYVSDVAPVLRKAFFGEMTPEEWAAFEAGAQLTPEDAS